MMTDDKNGDDYDEDDDDYEDGDNDYSWWVRCLNALLLQSLCEKRLWCSKINVA